MDNWKNSTASVQLPDSFPNAEAFERELVWRSANLLASSTFRDYFQQYVIAQGSAYLYLHGADGAPRDQVYFSLRFVLSFSFFLWL
jgi:hypothetical protein